MGLSRSGSLFSLSLVSTACPGLSLSARSFAQASLASSAPGCSSAGASISLQGFAQAGLVALVFSALRSESFALLLDASGSGPPSALQSLARLSLPALASDSSHVGSLSLLQSSARGGSTVLISGLSCLGFAFLPPVVNLAMPGPPFSARSLSKPALAVLVLAFARLESLMSARSMQRTSSSAPLCGISWLGLLLPAMTSSDVGLALLPRSFSHPGSIVLMLASGHLGFLMSMQSTLHLDFVVSLSGSARVGSCFPLLVIDLVHPDASLPPQNSGWAGSLMAALSFARFGPSLPIRDPLRPGFTAPALGCARVDFVSFLLVTNFASLGTFLPLQSFSHAGLAASALSSGCAGFLLSLRSIACGDSAVLVSGMSHPGLLFSLPIADHACTGPVMFARSLA